MSSPGRGPAARVRLRALFLLALLVGGSSLLFLISGSNDMADLLEDTERRKHQYQLKFDSTIRTEGCRIPFMTPFADSVLPSIKHPNIRCKANPLLQSNKTHIWVQQQNMHFYDVSYNGIFNCCYKPFYRPTRIDDITSPDTDKRVTYKECQVFKYSIKVRDEFVRVICGDTRKVFDTFFLFATEKKHREDDDSIKSNKTLPYNVLVLGIDGVSRFNMLRTMPKTVNYLYNLGVVDLIGYNKVGDNTFPNLIPMLIGRKDTELRETCVPNRNSSFDNCPFVWEQFRRAGARTALAEDAARLGTFNYVRRGFLATPTDYYPHTFMHQAEKHAAYMKISNTHLCMNDKFFYKILLDYVEHLTMLVESKLFGFFWETTMSHDFINYPMVMDDDYVNLLSTMHDSGYLNESIIFLVSDHGIRWGEFRSTNQGRLEERLPFVFALMPHSFRNKYSKAYENLKLNSRRLTTPFDMHATLLDLANIDNVENEKIIARSEEQYSRYRNISLFLPIPENRTCKTADIEDHWCTCYRSEPVSRDRVEVKEAVEHVLWHLNNLLKNYPQCHKLAAVEILESRKVLTDNQADVIEWPEFTVVVRTEPGGGAFEATLKRADGAGAGNSTRSSGAGARWALAGSVSRLNLYGDQSQCISDALLQLYCYCKS